MSQSPPSSGPAALPAAETAPPTISADALAAAAERRTRELPAQKSAAQLAKEHERKQKFRRLIDPGITRPNNKEDTVSSLNVRDQGCIGRWIAIHAPLSLIDRPEDR
jgi:hypothetical protein